MPVCVGCEREVNEGARFCPYCGANIQAVAAAAGDPYVGKLVAGKYLVEHLLGEGGMGKVYKAIQQPLDKAVVLKVLRQSLHGDASLVARFQREARAASRLNHPNSISVTDFGQMEDGALYIAMEYLEGRDLGVVLSEEGPLPEARLTHIMAQVLSALADAHAANIIHRDLKPENIMVVPRRDDPDYVKVLDFGIAKIQDPRDSPDAVALTQTGLVCGTPEYMSPEQARGQELDPRSDLYACGVILYQLTTGQLPFVAETSVGIVTKHLTEPPPSPRVLRPGLSAPLESLILRCMSKDPAQRPATAEALLAELKALSLVAPAAPVAGGTQVFGASAPSVPTDPGPGRPPEPRAAPVVAGASEPWVPADDDDEIVVPARRTSLYVAGIAIVAVAGIGGYFLASGSLGTEAAGGAEAEVATAGVSGEAGAGTSGEAGAGTSGEAGAGTSGEAGAGSTPSDPAGDATAAAPAKADPSAPAAGAPSDAAPADPAGKDAAPPKDAVAEPATKNPPAQVAKAQDTKEPPGASDNTEKTNRRKKVLPAAKTGAGRTTRTQARTGDPKKAQALIGKGDEHWAAGDFAKALREYLSAARETPNDAALQRKIGLAYLSVGKQDKAVRHLRRYLKLNPKAADRQQIQAIIAGG